MRFGLDVLTFAKRQNILLTADKHPVCKIADFGLAKLANFSVMQTMCGTPAYIAPEIILQDQRQRGYSAAVDSWSLGVIVYACLTNALPFVGENTQEPLQERMEARQPDMGLLDDLNISDNAYDFISALMDRNPATRLTPCEWRVLLQCNGSGPPAWLTSRLAIVRH